MKSIQRFAWAALASAIVLPMGSASAASLTINTTEPTGPGVVISHPHTTFATATPGPLGERDTFTTIFPISAGASVGLRGQTFIMPNNPDGPAFDLDAITLRADANAAGTGTAQDFSSGGPHTLKVWIFEWNPSTDANDGSTWTLGDGATDSDPFNGTSVTNFLVNGEVFDVTRSFAGEFLHFNTPGVQLADNTAYGILLAFESVATGFRLDSIRDNVTPNGESYANGGLLRSDATTNAVGSNGDDLVFYVQATPVPEPASAAILALGSVAALATRRRRQQ